MKLDIYIFSKRRQLSHDFICKNDEVIEIQNQRAVTPIKLTVPHPRAQALGYPLNKGRHAKNHSKCTKY